MSYVMSIHFINQGVLDSPFYPKGATDEQTAAFAFRFWFGYFTDSLFVQLQAIWDILMNILNHHYGYAYVNDQRMTGKLLKRLKREHPAVHAYIDQVWKSPVHQTVHQYRVNSAHNTSSINPTDTVTVDKNGVSIIGQGRYEKPSDMVDSMDRYVTFAARSIHGLLHEVRKEAEKA